MTKERDCPSEFALERLRFGELAGQRDEQRLNEHLADCPECRRKRDTLAQAEAPELDTHAIWTQGTSGRERATGIPHGSFWRRLRWAIALSAGAGTLATIALLAARPTPDIATKGSGTRLGVIAKRLDGTTTRLESGARLSKGDRLRFEILSSEPRAGIALILLDGAGTVTWLAPQGGPLSLPGSARTLLEEAVELDASLGPERIVLVACSRPVDADGLVHAARARLAAAGGDPLALGGLGTGCDEETFSFTKVEP